MTKTLNILLKTVRYSNAIPALVFAFAFGVRVLGIFSRPIWYDEAFAILFSEKGMAAMLYGTLSKAGGGTADIHPLGYYTLLWTWMKIFGQSVLAARLFSVVAGLASLVLVYQITRILFNKKTAILSMMLASILPFQVHFAQEIRMYSLLSFWLLLATFAFLRGQIGSWKWWILFGVSSALAQYTHNLAAIYLIPLALTPLFQRNTKLSRRLFLHQSSPCSFIYPGLSTSQLNSPR